MPSTAASVRRRLVARPEVRRLLWLTGLVLVAVGLALALAGTWPLAILAVVAGLGVVWLAGGWVAPRSSDAYVRRLMHLWRQWALDTQWSYDQFTIWQARFGSRLQALSPPPEYISDHERLVTLAEEQNRVRAKRSTAPEDARAMTDLQARAWELKGKLARHATTDEQRAYVDGLERLFADRRAEYARAAARSEQATDDALRSLSRVRGPAVADVPHQELRAAFEAHLAAARAFHEASQAAEANRVAEAAEGWTVSVGRLRDAMRHLADSVRYYDRWPDPTAPPDT